RGGPRGGEKREPVVEREGKSGELRGHVEEQWRARAIGEPEEDEREKDPAGAIAPVEGAQERERKKRGARVRERHAGAVVPPLLDRALPVDSVGEGQDRRPQPPRGLGSQHRLSSSPRRPPHPP